MVNSGTWRGLFLGSFISTLCAAISISPADGTSRVDVYPVRMQDREANAERSGVTATFFGFTPFPYDFTLAAVSKTRETIAPHSTLWALHYDNGIPWKEALADAPFPARVQQNWDQDAKAIPQGHVVYVGLALLDKDRKSLAPATGEKERVALPEELRGVPLDDANVKKAYLNYARRAVQQFRPRYLNLGIEAGDIMSRDFSRWAQFERLYEHVRAALKQEFPSMQIGISFGLATLRTPKEAEAAKALIAQSDYVGVSFYPYGSPFSEKFGAPPYRDEKPWREPLAWLRAYTDKPLALCETGFTTQAIEVPQFGLKMEGSQEAQAVYVQELFEIAHRDRYVFVVWFLAIDYDKLYAKMPPGSDVMKLWRNIGLFDGELQAKPAWDIWKAGVEASRRAPWEEKRGTP